MLNTSQTFLTSNFPIFFLFVRSFDSNILKSFRQETFSHRSKNTKHKLLSETEEKEKKSTPTYHQVHVDSPLVVANWNTQEDSRTRKINICDEVQSMVTEETKRKETKI